MCTMYVSYTHVSELCEAINIFTVPILKTQTKTLQRMHSFEQKNRNFVGVRIYAEIGNIFCAARLHKRPQRRRRWQQHQQKHPYAKAF